METNDKTDTATQLSPVKRAYLALQRMQARCDELEERRHAPIAIVGMACRFPGGADDTQAYWRLLAEGRDGVGELPADRWAKLAARASVDDGPPVGGFLTSPIDRFDPQFFGIAPREAECLDPQQRLLLEVSWEALEHAGQIEDRLKPSQTGVFVGITSHDYSQVLEEVNDLDRLDTYFITGSSLNAAAGRLSFTLGFQGPSIAIDTACSSSLVAIHQACRSLLNGECDRALAGGVNLILSPLATLALGRGGVLASDGHCKAFDTTADGMVRGEGCAVIVLKRLADALADGDNVLAVIRGSAVNQDGASSGLTVPNGPSQEAVVRQALKSARLEPDEIDYIEAHGTGTSLGDPIEAHALGNVFGRRDRPLVIGSVKTNIAHLEAASGIAGVVKVVLALMHEQVPPHLHFQNPSPHIRWDEASLKVAAQGQPWPANDRPRLAGVSSFGFSGTNAHVIIGEAPQASDSSQTSSETNAAAEARPLHVLALSAKSEQALVELAGRYDRYFARGPSDELADICFTANTGRGHWRHRLAFVGASVSDMQKQLAQLLSADASPAHKLATHGRINEARSGPPKLALLATGGEAGMDDLRRWSRDLHDTQPTFRGSLESCQDLLRSELDRPLLEVLFDENASSLELAQYARAALTAIEYALGQLWLSWGVRPSLIVGQGIGEYAGACLAGVLGLQEALVLSARSAGPPELLAEYARQIAYNTPQVAFMGRNDQAAVTTSQYWSQLPSANAVVPMDASRGRDCELVLSIGGNAASNRVFESTAATENPAGVSCGWPALLESLADLYRRGVAIDWRGFDRDHRRHRVILPSYPFQRERYWHESPDGTTHRKAIVHTPATSHPLLGSKLDLAGSQEIRFECRLGADDPAFLQDHRVFGNAVFPVAALLEIAIAGGSAALRTDQLELTDVVIEQALVLADDETTTLQTLLTPSRSNTHHATAAQDASQYSFQIFSRSGEVESWTCHASGHVCRLVDAAESQSVLDLAKARSDSSPETTDELYERCRQRGIEFGNSFRALRRFWRNDRSLVGEVRLPDGLARSADRYKIHPALLDGGLQILAALGLDADGEDNLLMPVAISRCRWMRLPGVELWSHMPTAGLIGHASAGGTESLTVDLEMVTPGGLPVAILEGLQLKSATRESVRRLSQPGLQNWLYRMQWRRADPNKTAAEIDSNGGLTMQGQRWLVLSTSAKDCDFSAKLARSLETRGAACTLVSAGDGYRKDRANSFVIDPFCRDDFQRLLGELPAPPGSPPRVILLAGSPGGASPDSLPHGMESLVQQDCASLLHLAQTFVETGSSAPSTVWTISCGAQAVIESEPVPGVAQAPLWGLSKSISLEHPELNCRYVDLDHGGDIAQLDMLCADLASDDEEPHIAYRGRQRFVARMAPCRERPGTSEQRFRSDASYLVTGGLRGLGLEVASWLAERGAGHLVLAGRSAPSDQALQRIDALRQAGTAVDVEQADVSDAGQIAALLERLADGSPLRGVVHCAAVLDDGILVQQTPERFRHVLAPKVGGAWNLHALTRDMPLDFFVLFSSAASLLGSAAQGSYCAANAFLDSLAEHRRASGLPGLSVNWGPWAGTGMVARSREGSHARDLAEGMIARGLQLIPPRQGLQVLGQLLAMDLGQAAVAPGAWSKLEGRSRRDTPTLLHDLLSAETGNRDDDNAGQLLATLNEADAERRRDSLIEFLRENVAGVFRSRPDQVEINEPLNMLGLDSLMAVELRNRVNARLGIDVPVVKFMEGQSVLDLAAEIDHRLPSHASADEASAEPETHDQFQAPTDVNELNALEAEELLGRLDDLSDEDVEALLTSHANASDEGTD